MRRFVTLLTAVVAVAAFSTIAFAQATTAAKPATATAPAAAVKPAAATTPAPAVKPVAATTQTPAAKPVKPAKLSAKGEGKYDEATKMLTVGDKTFTLAPDAKIMMGAKAATTADLTGKNVMVTYTVVDGKNVASKVTIAAAKPAAKAAAPKK
jgi:hypothetical protein